MLDPATPFSSVHSNTHSLLIVSPLHTRNSHRISLLGASWGLFPPTSNLAYPRNFLTLHSFQKRWAYMDAGIAGQSTQYFSSLTFHSRSLFMWNQMPLPQLHGCLSHSSFFRFFISHGHTPYRGAERMAAAACPRLTCSTPQLNKTPTAIWTESTHAHIEGFLMPLFFTNHSFVNSYFPLLSQFSSGLISLEHFRAHSHSDGAFTAKSWVCWVLTSVRSFPPSFFQNSEIRSESLFSFSVECP